MELPQHKIIGLIGPNGSGKSTTLKLIAGLMQPSSGKLTVLGRPGAQRGNPAVAFAPDDGALYRFYTVGEMVAFSQGMFADFDPQRAKGLLSFMQLAPTTRVFSLSKGNAARLRMALTLSRTAPLLLMDEPLSGLDPMVRSSVVKSLISFVDLQRQTVILSTHEVAEIEPLLDMAALLHEGRLLALKPVEDIQKEGHSRGLTGWMEQQITAGRNLVTG